MQVTDQGKGTFRGKSITETFLSPINSTEQGSQLCRKKPKGIIISSDYYYVWMIKNVILIAFLLAGRNSYQLDEILIGPQDFYFLRVIFTSRA